MRSQRFRPRSLRLGAALFALALVAAACSGSGSDDTSTGDATTTTAAEAAGSTTTTEADTGSGEVLWEVTFFGELEEIVDRGGRIIKNFGELEETPDGLVGTVSFASEGQVGLEDGAEVGTIACVQIEVDFEPGDLVVGSAGDEVEVELTRKLDLMYRACPPSLNQDGEPETVDIVWVDDSTVTGSFTFNETLIEFEAVRLA